MAGGEVDDWTGNCCVRATGFVWVVQIGVHLAHLVHVVDVTGFFAMV
jgi:hypothetical protein